MSNNTPLKKSRSFDASASKELREQISNLSLTTKNSFDNFKRSTKPVLSSTKNSLSNFSDSTKTSFSNFSDSTKLTLSNTKTSLTQFSGATKNSISNYSKKNLISAKNVEDLVLVSNLKNTISKSMKKKSEDSDDEEMSPETILRKVGCEVFYPEKFIKPKQVKEIQVCICTWNVGESYSASIGQWVFKDHPDFDIYSIGLQEVDMSVKTIIKNDSSNKTKWDQHFDYQIDSKKYTKLISQQLVGLYHVIYIKKEHLQQISKVNWSKIGFGKFALGNKGCIAYQFELYGNNYCFINCHFAAGQKHISKRNANFELIMNEELFKNEKINPLKQDFVYFFGDLNYRLNLNREEVLECVKKKNWTKLALKDQLIEQKLNNSNIFRGFEEEYLDFNPTYKFEKWTDHYDKKRIPSYCDRILIKGNKKKYKIFGYETKLDECSSDHRPLICTFNNSLF
eukprot:gene12571-6391_t